MYVYIYIYIHTHTYVYHIYIYIHVTQADDLRLLGTPRWILLIMIAIMYPLRRLPNPFGQGRKFVERIQGDSIRTKTTPLVLKSIRLVMITQVVVIIIIMITVIVIMLMIVVTTPPSPQTAQSYHVISYCTVPYRTVPYRTALHRTAPHRTAPHRIIWHRVIHIRPWCPMNVCDIISHDTISQHAMSCNIML